MMPVNDARQPYLVQPLPYGLNEGHGLSVPMGWVGDPVGFELEMRSRHARDARGLGHSSHPVRIR